MFDYRWVTTVLMAWDYSSEERLAIVITGNLYTTIGEQHIIFFGSMLTLLYEYRSTYDEYQIILWSRSRNLSLCVSLKVVVDRRIYVCC